jgi:hypothetical protein
MCKLVVGFDARQEEFTIHDPGDLDARGNVIRPGVEGDLLKTQLENVLDIADSLKANLESSDGKDVTWPKNVLALDVFSPEPAIYINMPQVKYIYIYPCALGHDALEKAKAPTIGGTADGKKA